jgi:hypothetical protein
MQSPHGAVLCALWLDLGQESCLTWRESRGQSFVGSLRPDREQLIVKLFIFNKIFDRRASVLFSATYWDIPNAVLIINQIQASVV